MSLKPAKFGWLFVFHNQLVGKLRANASQAVDGIGWWLKVDGAYWAKRRPRQQTRQAHGLSRGPRLLA